MKKREKNQWMTLLNSDNNTKKHFITWSTKAEVCPRGAVANALDYEIVVSGFELQSCY